MPAAKVVDGRMIQLDGKRQPDRILTENDVQDPAKLSKELTAIVSDVASKQREHNPRHIDFEDQVCEYASTLTLPHGLNGRVRWWVVDWTASIGTPLTDSGSDVLTVYGPMLVRDASRTDNNTLVLSSFTNGTATIRVQEAG